MPYLVFAVYFVSLLVFGILEDVGIEVPTGLWAADALAFIVIFLFLHWRDSKKKTKVTVLPFGERIFFVKKFER